ncbi:hypothetical protein O6H91_09G124300 [Diphasiastrum complanatum]|uniref:Uncharacterized protein n=1 Tax=Diphasiastrum complanatum TaxID=34168 RepID=A0ACC2CU28_DIPCM|nr:hypothetical protein O6H91_09G124300 [Diphasiastrum complanatum]
MKLEEESTAKQSKGEDRRRTMTMDTRGRKSRRRGSSCCSASSALLPDCTNHVKLRRRLHEELETVRGLLNRIEARQQHILRSKELSGQGNGSGADSAQPSSSGQEGSGAIRVSMKKPGGAFTKERRAVGARMALASFNGSDSRETDKKQSHDPETANKEFSGNKRPERGDLSMKK